MSLLAAFAGYLVGSIPTAAPLGRIWGVRLREQGSGNPGANNALRLGGPVLAATVLLLEVAKGLAAVQIGSGLAGDIGAVAAAIGAVAGNVYNLWYRLEGGKGLAISAGVLLGVAPALLMPALAVLVVVAILTKSSGAATLGAVVTLNAAAVTWWLTGWSPGWGIGSGPLLVLLSGGIGLVLWPKHRAEARVSEPVPR